MQAYSALHCTVTEVCSYSYMAKQKHTEKKRIGARGGNPSMHFVHINEL